jgi:hypothetical protein
MKHDKIENTPTVQGFNLQVTYTLYTYKTFNPRDYTFRCHATRLVSATNEHEIRPLRCVKPEKMHLEGMRNLTEI